MPKIGLRAVSTAIPGNRRVRDANSIYKDSFILIDGINSIRNQRRLARYFYDHTRVDPITNKIVPCYLVVRDQGLCMISNEPSFREAAFDGIDIIDLSEFIANFNNYVRGSYEVGLIPVDNLPDNLLDDNISCALFVGRVYTNLQQNPGFDLRINFYNEENRVHLRCTGDEKEFVISDMIFEALVGFLENIHAHLFSVSSEDFINDTENEKRQTLGEDLNPAGLRSAKRYQFKPYYIVNGPNIEEPELPQPQPININNEVEEVELPDFNNEVEAEHNLQGQGPAVANRVEDVNKELRKNNNKKSKKKRRI